MALQEDRNGNRVELINEVTSFDEVFNKYSQAISNGQDTTLNFILVNKNKIREAVGFFGFKQFTLNYRIYFDQRNLNKILHDYKKYVLSKTIRHKSDLAISHNMLTKIQQLDHELENNIVEFMYERMRDTYLVKFNHLKVIPFKVKRHLCISHIYDELLRVKDRGRE
jgi:hypothetical protein